MFKNIENIGNKLDSGINTLPASEISYSGILNKYGITYKVVGHYVQVGEITWVQGWILHISVIWIQVEKLIKTIIPFLLSNKIPFQIVKDADTCRSILNGHFGLIQLGKIAAIYPYSDEEASYIAQFLIEITSSLSGPRILTDRHLGGVVYTRYGACNPVIAINEIGKPENYIYDANGNLAKDQYSIPFIMPDGIKWPFDNIVYAKEHKKDHISRDKYKLMSLLKSDAKGDVRKVLRLEKWYKIKWAVIKEAKYKMIADSNARDVCDRLRWQFELHKQMEGWLPIPKVYDLFEEDGNTYMVMDYVKGNNLDNVIQSIFQGKSWDHLPLKDRLKLLDFTLQILDIIISMHEKGYIHRDITPVNFLVDKNQHVWMIDLELAYSDRLKKPFPPFDLGTWGFISPEQYAILQPTREQDVYSIGCTLICLLTGLLPGKFAIEDHRILKKQLSFFISNNEIVDLVVKCVNKDYNARPNVLSLKKSIVKLSQQQNESLTVSNSHIIIVEDDIKKIINGAVNGLTTPIMMNDDTLWFSKTLQDVGFDYYQVESGSVYGGFSEGLSGVLYLIACVKKIGLPVDLCLNAYNINLNHLNQLVNLSFERMTASLYMGTSGIALALAEGIKAGLIENDESIVSDIQLYLENQRTIGLNVATGVAGRGLAILRASNLLNNSFVNESLNDIIGLLIQLQQKDGSWSSGRENKNHDLVVTGFGHGMAGIISFLIEYIHYYKNELAENAAIKALDWITKKAQEKNGKLIWSINNKVNQVEIGFNNGVVGIALALLKAYQVIGNPIYRNLAEKVLNNIPFPIVSRDTTLANGLAGIGELYIEAAKVFNNVKWKEKATWIVEFLMHNYRLYDEKSLYWMVDSTSFVSANLMAGNCGIIHFLLRYYKPEMLTHPLISF